MDRTRTVVQLVQPASHAENHARHAITSVAQLSESPADLSSFISRLPREFIAYLDEPLPQRPAGSPGKRGQCSLAFRVRQGKTQLQHSFVSHPFHFTHPWHLDPALPDMAVVYVQTPAGGLIQGDQAAMQFTLESSAWVHITTQAAEKIHTMTANCALQYLDFTLAADAYAEYCPEPVILFPRSRFAQELQVELGDNARFFMSEIFLVPMGMALFDAFTSCLSVREANGRLLLHERGVALSGGGDLDGPGIFDGYRVWGQAVFVGPQVSPAVVKDIHSLLAGEPEVWCGATLLPRARGVAVKVIGAQVSAVRRVLHAAWHFLRWQWLQVPAPRFLK